MTITNRLIEPEHRQIVAKGSLAPSLNMTARGGLYSLLALCAVLTACGASQPTEPGGTPASTKAQALSAVELSPALPVPTSGPGGGPQMFAAAGGNGLYLVVYMDSTAQGPDITGVRVRASDGAILDSSPIRIATGSNIQLFPSVAFDGTNFLVAWSEIVGAPTVYATRVRASDGAVLDTPAIFISRTPMPPGQFANSYPAVAFDGSNYLVTWDGAFIANNQYWSGVMGIRVRASDGAVIDSSVIRIGANGRASRVAYSNASGSYLVTWETYSGTVQAARVSASSGQVLDTTPLAVASGNARGAAVAARDGEFLVVWRGGDNGLWGRRVRASDGVKLGTADILVGPASVSPPEVTFDGAEYWIVWQGTRGGVLEALVTRVTADGGVEPDAELVLGDLPASTQAQRAGVAAAGAGLVLTVQLAASPSSGPTAGMMRLATTAQVPSSP